MYKINWNEKLEPIYFRDVLVEGGSAVDAAIATLFCNGVYNSQSMGLGGGFLMTIFEAKVYRVTY